MATHAVSERRACRVVQLNRSLRVYQPKRVKDEVIQEMIRHLGEAHPTWGCGKMVQAMRRAGQPWNHKRIERIYHEMNFHRRSRVKKRRPHRQTEPLTPSYQPNECWSIDFMRDSLSTGRAFRTFNVIDNFNREALGIFVETSLPSTKVTQLLEEIAWVRGYPKRLRLDNGPEFTAHHFQNWATQNVILLDFTEPGSPYQNGYVERFNRTFREDILDANWFDTLQEVKTLANEWVIFYNEQRPHDALNGLTPAEFLASSRTDSLLSHGSI